jgi:hypothetical protein
MKRDTMNKFTSGLLTVLILSSATIFSITNIVRASGIRPNDRSSEAGKIGLSQAKSFSSFKTNFTGNDKCLDVVNDGTNDRLQMADCGNFSGQFWSTVATGTKGYVRLRNNFTGNDKCLDVVNDGNNNRLQMADCGNFSGQFWQLSKPSKTSFYRMRNQFTGAKKCLDIVNDGTNNKLQMADCGNFSGQQWQINKK